jgi:hypothetical protein
MKNGTVLSKYKLAVTYKEKHSLAIYPEVQNSQKDL